MLLLDVTPLSLGIETMGGVMSKIIPRNSTIPASATEMFTTFIDGQTNVKIHVLQGERELVKDCRSLAQFDLKDIPPMTAGMPRIEVKFLIDADGILSVAAQEQRTGKYQSIEVKPTYGLTDEQVEQMILESFEYAEADIEARQVIEARNEAETVLECNGEGYVRRSSMPSSPQKKRAEITAATKNLREVMRARRSSGDPRRHRASKPCHDAPGRTHHEFRDFKGAERQTREGNQNEQIIDWTTTEDIAIALADKFPDNDPLTVRFTDLLQMGHRLEGFSDDPKNSNEKKLEAIQMAWHEEWQDRRK